MNKRTTLKTLFAGTVLALGSFAAIANEPIKIGSILSVTGPAAFLGDPELKTLQLYVEEINKKGGVLGRQIQLVHYDDGSDANKANGFAKRLIDDDKVDLIVGGTTTGSTMSTVPLVERAGVPFISLAGVVQCVLNKYDAVCEAAPIRCLGLHEIGEVMQRREVYDSARIEAHFIRNVGLAIVADRDVLVPITGACAGPHSEHYAGQSLSWLPVAAHASALIPLPHLAHDQSAAGSPDCEAV